MNKYKFIPYDKKLVLRARELRKSETVAEKKFWEKVIKDKRLAHLKFTRQKPIGNFLVDFYCAKYKLAIEIDGEVHKYQFERDLERDNILKQKFGVKVLRYKNKEVLNNLDKVSMNLFQLVQNLTLQI